MKYKHDNNADENDCESPKKNTNVFWLRCQVENNVFKFVFSDAQ